MAELKIKISADVANSLQGLSAVQIRGEQLRRNIEKLQSVIANTTSQRKLESALAALTQQQAAYNKTVQAAPNALNGLKNSANAANNVLINSGRILQDLPFGIIGVANNINPLLESFQRLSAQAKETGTSVGKTLLQALTGGGGLGFAFSAITAAASFAAVGISAFTRGMGASKGQSDETSAAYKELSESLEQVKKSAERAENQLQFLNRLGSINVKILGLGNLEDLRQQSAAQQKITSDLRDEQKRIFNEYLAFSNKSNDDLKITQDERLKLEDNFRKSLKDIDEKINKSSDDQRVIFRQIQLQKNDDAKKALEEQKRLFEEFQKKTIERAKQIEDAFGDAFKLPKLEEDLNTSFEDVFKNALKVIERFNKGTLIRFGIKPVIDKIEKVELPPEFSKTVTDLFEKAQGRLKTLKPSIDLSELNKGFKEAQKQAQILYDNTINAANIIAGTLAPAFNGLFDAIVSGGDALKGFFEGLKQSIVQLTQKLISAALQAAILSALTQGTGNPLSFLGAFKSILGFRASGGPVNRNSPYVVGERGPELFVPSVSGNIIPNNRMGSVSSGGVQVFLSGEFVQRGNDMVAVINRTNQSQGRLV